MSVVTIKKCDVCGQKSDEHERWGIYTDCNQRPREVCTDCEKRLFAVPQ